MIMVMRVNDADVRCLESQDCNGVRLHASTRSRLCVTR